MGNEPVGVVSCFVPGIPLTEGSTKAVPDRSGRVHIIHVKQDELNTWRGIVRRHVWDAATKAGWPLPLDEPVGVTAKFWLPRKRTVKRAMPCVKPDLDKLARAVGDALQDGRGAILVDDSRIIVWGLVKRYADHGREPGVDLTLTRLGVPF